MIKKLKSLDIERYEKNFARWAYASRYRIITLTLVVLILMSTFFMPYLNLVVTSYYIILISLVLAPFILDMEAKVFLVAGLILFCLVFFVWTLGKTEEAESLANYVYIFLLSGSLKALLS